MNKTEPIKNTVYDEANQVTYEVIAPRTLTDGELFRAIRGAILRGGRRPAKGDTLVIQYAEAV
jgi:hypothetical protein